MECQSNLTKLGGFDDDNEFLDHERKKIAYYDERNKVD